MPALPCSSTSTPVEPAGQPNPSFPQTLYSDKIDNSSLENPGIRIIWNGGPTRTLENSAALFSRLGCADDAIANFPPTLDAGPRRCLRRGPVAAPQVPQLAATLLVALQTLRHLLRLGFKECTTRRAARRGLRPISGR